MASPPDGKTRAGPAAGGAGPPGTWQAEDRPSAEAWRSLCRACGQSSKEGVATDFNWLGSSPTQAENRSGEAPGEDRHPAAAAA